MGEKDGKMAPAIQGMVSRNVKDGVFRTLFKEDREALLQLYNALNGTDYADASALEIVTIENAVYIVMKNDLAFVLTDTLNLYEHQSSVHLRQEADQTADAAVRGLLQRRRGEAGQVGDAAVGCVRGESRRRKSRKVKRKTPHFGQTGRSRRGTAGAGV